MSSWIEIDQVVLEKKWKFKWSQTDGFKDNDEELNSTVNNYICVFKYLVNGTPVCFFFVLLYMNSMIQLFFCIVKELLRKKLDTILRKIEFIPKHVTLVSIWIYHILYWWYIYFSTSLKQQETEPIGDWISGVKDIYFLAND